MGEMRPRGKAIISAPEGHYAFPLGRHTAG